jgi:hypothetical protein
MGPHAGVDYKRTLCRLQHMYYGQPYVRVDLNPYARVDLIPQSAPLDLASDYSHRLSYIYGNFLRRRALA